MVIGSSIALGPGSTVYYGGATIEASYDFSNTASITDTTGLVDSVADLSGNNRTATATGTARPTTGATTVNSLNVLDFDGGDSLAIADFEYSTDDFTIFIPCAFTNTGAEEYLFSHYDTGGNQRSWGFYKTTGDDLALVFSSDGTAFLNVFGGASAFTLTDFNILAVRYKGGASPAINLYINGTLLTTTGDAPAMSLHDSTANLLIGARLVSGSASGHFTGSMGEVKFYDKAVSDSQIISISNELGIKWGVFTAPVNSVAPAVSGNTGLGDTLTTTNGTWTGTPAPAYAYQWQRDGVDISDATSSTYDITAADSAADIRCVVTATNFVGSASANSNAITVDTFSAPVNTVAPVASGSTTVGSLLSVTDGTWTGGPTPSYTYQWQRDGVNIASATANTYTTVSADIGTDVRCVVTGTNAFGSASANSNAISVVASSVNLSSLYAASEEGGYYSVQDLTKVKQNSDGTGDAAVGSPVGYIEDLSGNGRHAQQTVSSRRPTLRQTGGGRYYLEFDGVDDRMTITGGSVINLSSATVSMFMAMDTTDTQAIILAPSATSAWVGAWVDGDSSTVLASSGASHDKLYIDDVDTAFTTRDSVHTAIATGTILPQMWNLTLGATGNNLSASHALFGYPAFEPACDIYGFGWRSAAVTGSSDITLVNDWCKQEAGL